MRADLEQAIRADEFGAPPQGPVTEAPVSSNGHAPEGIFSAADLYDFMPSAVQYPMPNGKSVWVHPMSPEEVTWLNLMAFREVQRLAVEADEAGYLRQERAKIWQVVACCRVGETGDAPRVFQPENAAALRRNRGWWQAVRDICRISDGLGSQETALTETLRDFFGILAEALHSTSSSLPNEGSESACLARCGLLVSSIQRRGTLTPSDLEALRAATEG